MRLYLLNIYYKFLWWVTWAAHCFVLPLRYNIKVVNLEKLKELKSGILFLSNHTSNLDPILIVYAVRSLNIPIIIWAANFVFNLSYLKYAGTYIKDHLGVIKVPTTGYKRNQKDRTNVHHLIKRTIEGLENDNNYILFPSGHSKYTPLEQINGKSAAHTIRKLKPDTHVVIVRINGMWGSRFSWASKRHKGWTTERKRFSALIKDVYKILCFNGIFFIPRRDVTIEFIIPDDLPKKASRVEFNRYLEAKFNEIWDDRGEILSRVSDYFWKEQYNESQYSVKNYLFDTKDVSQEIKQTVLEIVAKTAGVDQDIINPSMDLARTLGLDSLEITDILIALENKYFLPVTNPDDVTTVDHLFALAGRVDIKRETRTGSFRHVYQKPLPFSLW